MSPESRPLAPGRRRLAGWLFAIAVAAYAVLLTDRVGAIAGGSDSSGYLNNAKLLRDGHARAAQRMLDRVPPGRLDTSAFVPLGFRPIQGDDMAPTYPTGLPLLFAASSVFAGWDDGPRWTIILHGILGAMLVFGLGRQCGLSPGFAGIAAVVVALSPLYLFIAFQPLSDMPSLVWVTGSVMIAWRSRTSRSALLPLAAGAAFAMAVLVRPTNLLAIAPLAVALGLDWKRWLLFALGGLPGAVFLAMFNHAAYGSMFEQGYQGIPDLLSVQWAARTVIHYARWLPLLLTPVAVLALGLPLLSRGAPRVTLMLGAWIAVFGVFYACYYFTHEVWWSLRFVLPLFPALAVAALLVLQRFSTWITHPAARLTAGFALASAAAAWSWHQGVRLAALDISRSESVYRDSVMWARENLPDDAVIVAMQTSGALFFYSNFTILRWDHVSEGQLPVIHSALAEGRRPLFALLFEHEVKEVTEVRFPGGWTKIGAIEHATVWKREPVEVDAGR